MTALENVQSAPSAVQQYIGKGSDDALTDVRMKR